MSLATQPKHEDEDPVKTVGDIEPTGPHPAPLEQLEGSGKYALAHRTKM